MKDGKNSMLAMILTQAARARCECRKASLNPNSEQLGNRKARQGRHGGEYANQDVSVSAAPGTGERTLSLGR
jgi:hypothetical protein